MSVETLSGLPSIPLKQIDVLVNPDPGGTTITFARPIDRNLPSVEPQELGKTPTIEFENDFRGIDRVRRFFKDGGVIMPEDILNYNPIFARWGFEEASKAGSVEEFKKHETIQVETALRERYCSSKSVIIYTIDENQRLRNDIYPKEPFAEGIQRGVLSLRQQGSPDSEREEKEVEGFLKIEKVMTDPDTVLNTKMMVVSPPSKLKGSIYVKNFVDFYELVKDEQTGKRVIRMTRLATNATYGDVTDAYLLSHPTRIDSDTRSAERIFQEMFGKGKDVVEEKYMQEILSKSEERIRFYINALCNPSSTAESIAVAFHAVLNGADFVGRGLQRIADTIFKGSTRVMNSLPAFKEIEEEVEWLGRQRVEQIAAACGMSGGLSIRRLLNGIGRLISNFSSIFSGGFLSISIEGADYHLGSCVVCRRGNVLVGGCDICTNCEQNL